MRVMRTTLTLDQELELRAWLESGRAIEIRSQAAVSRSSAARDLGIAESALYRWEHNLRVPRGLHAASYYRLLRRLADREAVTS